MVNLGSQLHTQIPPIQAQFVSQTEQARKFQALKGLSPTYSTTPNTSEDSPGMPYTALYKYHTLWNALILTHS